MAKKNIKEFYKSKTFWIAVVQAIIGITSFFVTEYPEVGVALIAKSALDVLLRSLTTERIKV